MSVRQYLRGESTLRTEAECTEAEREALRHLKDPIWIKKRLRHYEARVFYFDLVECLRKLLVRRPGSPCPPRCPPPPPPQHLS